MEYEAPFTKWAPTSLVYIFFSVRRSSKAIKCHGLGVMANWNCTKEETLNQKDVLQETCPRSQGWCSQVDQLYTPIKIFLYQKYTSV